MVDNAKYRDRDGIYMHPDDAERFIFLCRAAVEMLKIMEWQPDIIHCAGHDGRLLLAGFGKEICGFVRWRPGYEGRGAGARRILDSRAKKG